MTPYPAPLPPIPIVLIGMPGVGKSTVGQALARRTCREFLDTDRLIEAATGRGLAELLAVHGSAGFLAIEGRALREALALSRQSARGAVIATGGSAIYCEAEMQEIRGSCRIVHLEAPLALIAQRAGDLERRGVVRRPGQSIEALFAERTRLCRRYAHLSLTMTDESPGAVGERLELALQGAFTGPNHDGGFSMLDAPPTDAIGEIIETHRTRPGALLPILHAIQDALGWVPDEAVPAIARALNLSRAEVHGAISFYPHFRTAAPGRHVVQVCRAESCQARGAEALEAHAKRSLGVDFHGTTPDGAVTLEAVHCLGNCACSPAVRVDDEIIGRVDAERFDQAVAELRAEAKA